MLVCTCKSLVVAFPASDSFAVFPGKVFIYSASAHAHVNYIKHRGCTVANKQVLHRCLGRWTAVYDTNRILLSRASSIVRFEEVADWTQSGIGRINFGREVFGTFRWIPKNKSGPLVCRVWNNQNMRREYRKLICKDGE